MRDTLGVLLAGGAGERLFPLTRDRAKPAVPFAGQYRIIDITLSNCINSDLRHVYILTQYKALSLNRHIREGWGPVVANELGEFIEILPPMQRVSKSWYQGTADAVYQNIYSIGAEEPKHVLILSGDHIYKMNYGRMQQQHKDSGADVTLATLPITPDEVYRFGVVEVARNGEVTGFVEKPKSTDLRSPFSPDMVDASMGIYLFNTDILLPELMKDAGTPTPPTTSATTYCPSCSAASRCTLITSSTRTSSAPSTGAMWARSKPTSRPTWTWLAFRPSSTSTTRAGPCAPGPTSTRPQSSSSANPDAPAWPSTPSSAPAPSSPARWCATPSSPRMCASTHTPT
jgi:dTDP-glucose pyrophosphorylase